MPPKGALTAGELTALAGAHQAKWYLAVVNNVTAATAQVDAPGGLTFPLATLNVKNTSGNWASVAQGMSVAIGLTPGAADIGLYRIRKAGTGTTMNIGETAWGDLGLITRSIRNSIIQNNAYITTYLNRYDIWSVVPRIIAATNTLYEDYDKTVGTFNTTPPPTLNITINGTTDRWPGFADAGQTYRTVVLVATATVWPTSASISSYAWTIPGTWTVTGGSIATNTVTCQVPTSAYNYTVSVTATDNNSGAWTAVRPVWAFDRSGANVPIPIFSLNRSWDRTGAKATVTLNNDALANVPLGAMVYLFSEATWNGPAQDILSASTGQAGWVVQQTENTEPGLRSAELEIVGPTGLLEKLGSYSQYFADTGSPANWQQVVPALSYVDYLIYWILAQRAANVLTLFNYTPMGISNTTGRMPTTRIEAAGNLLAQCQQLAQSYCANFGSNPDGEIMVRLNPQYMTASPRSSVTTRWTVTASTYKTLNPVRENKPRVRRVRGEAFYWDGVAAIPTPYLADAPGDALGQGTADDRLQGQVVDSQDDLDYKTGFHYALVNNPYLSMPLMLEGNYAMVYPAEMEWLALTAPATLRPDNAALSMNTLPASVSQAWQANGTADTTIEAEGETSGVSAVAVPVPAQATTTTTYSSLPVTTTTSTGIGTPTHNGGTVIAMTAANIGISTSWFDSSPSWTTIAKPSGTLIYLLLDPFSDFLGVTQTGNLGAWCLTTSGLYYTANVLTTTPVWGLKNSLSPGITSGVLRAPIWAQGVVYVAWVNSISPCYAAKLSSYGTTTDWSKTIGYGNDLNSIGLDIDQYGTDEALVGARDLGTGTWSHTFDFTVNNGGFTSIYGIYSGGQWNAGSDGVNSVICDIRKAISVNTTITSVRVIGSAQSLPNTGSRGPSSNVHTDNTLGPNTAGAFDFTATINYVNPTYLQYNIDTSGLGTTQVNYLTRMIVSGTGSNPFDGSASIYRVLNGGAPSALTGMVLTGTGTAVNFVQKPLKTWAGGTNNNTGASEALLAAGHDNTGATFIRETTNGGSTVTDVKPVAGVTIPPLTSSAAYTDNTNIMLALSGSALYTTINGGTAWTNRGASTLHSTTMGFFPRLLNGNYALYLGGSSGISYSPDLGITVQDKTGNWATAVGAASNFISCIPLY